MTYQPARGVVIVKPIETEETLPGGLIVLTENARKDWAQWQMEVVAVGKHEVCAKPRKCNRRHGEMYHRRVFQYKFHDVDERLKPGSWVIVKHRSIVPLSPDTDLYAVRHDDVMAIFDVA